MNLVVTQFLISLHVFCNIDKYFTRSPFMVLPPLLNQSFKIFHLKSFYGPSSITKPIILVASIYNSFLPSFFIMTRCHYRALLLLSLLSFTLLYNRHCVSRLTHMSFSSTISRFPSFLTTHLPLEDWYIALAFPCSLHLIVQPFFSIRDSIRIGFVDECIWCKRCSCTLLSLSPDTPPSTYTNKLRFTITVQ